MPTSPAPAAPRPRAALWLTGAAALALAVQAIFVLGPEPKSADATDPAAPEAAASLDSTAFTLEETATMLPGATPTDSAARPATDSTLRPSPFDGSELRPVAPVNDEKTPRNIDTAALRPPPASLSAPLPASLPDSTDGAPRQ